ncbi:DUF3025 domain-containing protein [Dyella japonica]|uniref:DUF3025 domain-containing protein n=1 Tax=Dyella japonica A8 TaxID=1217721 RepID=A0A075K2Z4_9GAMM|nr:DUF3025 domain-containing protein [Dyella japonica]AIF48579.1 hypothetical protein HY57_15720 [Dyella japonica A8]
MRYIAPARESVDPAVFTRWPLCGWREYNAWMQGAHWPSIDELNAARPTGQRERFIAQTQELLGDGLHYEQRIAERGDIATREANWHDLFNAFAWLRYPSLKRALNAQQMAGIALMGARERSRAQYALTHFDEAGVIVSLRDRALLALWDAHDWYGLFWRERAAWLDGRAAIHVFGHALLEHALTPGKLLVGKALVVVGAGEQGCPVSACVEGIEAGLLLRDPLDLRPLPLSGLPGWHPDSDTEAFHHHAACYQPRREGREYPLPILR